MRVSTFKYLGLATVLVASSVLLAACGGAQPEKKPVNANAAKNIEEVCEGKTYDAATAYDGSKKGVHPTVFVTRDQIDKKFMEASSMVPKEWVAEKYAQAEVVVCADSVSTTKVKECPIKNLAKPEDAPRMLEMHDEVYKISVREAKTAKELSTKEVTLKAESKCPALHFFAPGATREVYRDTTTLKLEMFDAADPFSEVK